MKRMTSVLLAVLMLTVCLCSTGCSVVEKVVDSYTKSDYELLHDYIQENGVLTDGGYYVTSNTKGNYDYGFMLDDSDELMWYISSETSGGADSFLSLYLEENSTQCEVLMSFGEDTTMSATINPATYSRTNSDLQSFRHNGYASLGDTYEKLCASTLSLLVVYVADILPDGVTMEGLGFLVY